MKDLGDAQTGGIRGGESRVILEVGDGSQELRDFGGAQDDGECGFLARTRDVGDGPVFPEGDAVQEASGADALVDTTPGDLLVMNQVQLIRTNVFGPE